MKALHLTVYGVPAPQGSKSFKGLRGGKPLLVESSAGVKPWREAVRWTACAQMALGHIAFQGPVCLDVAFTLARPKSAKAGAKPATRPDLSKLVRATEDALTDAGVWRDDGQVVSCLASKQYVCASKQFVGPDGGLDRPGARITITEAL